MRGLERLGRVAGDRLLEPAKALVDRLQLDDRGPGVDQVLERRAHLVEGVEDLVHQPQGDRPGDDGRRQHDVGEDAVDLQVQDASDIEVHVVEIHAEIVPPDVGEQLLHGRRPGAVGVILAVDQLLPIGRLDALVAELEPRQPDADQRQKGGAERRPGQGRHDQGAVDLPDDGQVCHLHRQVHQNGEEGD